MVSQCIAPSALHLDDLLLQSHKIWSTSRSSHLQRSPLQEKQASWFFFPCPAFFFIAHFWSLHASGLAYLSEQPHWAQLRFSPWILRVSETAWIHLPRLSLENGCHQVSVWLRSLQFFISRPWQPFSDRLPGIEVVVDGGGVDDFKFRPHGATVSNASCVVAFRRAACVVAPSSPRRNDFPGAKCNNGNPGGKAPFCVN